jgi:hypothetical protein
MSTTHSKHSRLHSVGVVQCVIVQSQQTRPGGQRSVEQSGGETIGVHPVVLDPGGQHCAAIVTAWADKPFPYGASERNMGSPWDVAAIALNPGILIVISFRF